MMIDCALPETDSYGNRLRGLDRVGRRPSATRKHSPVAMARVNMEQVKRAQRVLAGFSRVA